MKFQFLHAADIHLDSPLRGLERYEDAPVEAVRSAPRAAFEKLVALAIDSPVAFLLIAGDLYDGDWKDYNTGLFFVQQMRRLDEAGIPVYLVSGNHDATSRLTKTLTLPPNVHHFESAQPGTAVLSDLDVVIHGQSFAGRSVPEDLSAAYPQAVPGRFEIGLLHTSLDGRPGHADYAPCSREGLIAKGYDYWALGHVHAREEVASDPWIVFPGNIQGRHARETGPKGASLVSVESGEVVSVEHVALDVVRWVRLDVDLSEQSTVEAGLDAISFALEECAAGAEGRLVAARLTLSGTTPAHAAWIAESERWQLEIREAANRVSGAGVWLEKIVFSIRPARELEGALERTDALGGLLRWAEALEADDAQLGSLVGEFDSLAKKLPAALRSGEAPFVPTEAETLQRLVPSVRDLLLARLLGSEDAP